MTPNAGAEGLRFAVEVTGVGRVDAAGMDALDFPNEPSRTTESDTAMTGAETLTAVASSFFRFSTVFSN